MARNFLQEWDDQARVMRENERKSNVKSFVDPSREEDFLKSGEAIGIPMFNIKESPRDVIKELLGLEDKGAQGPEVQVASYENPTPIEEPEQDVAKDDLWAEVGEIDPWPEFRKGIEGAALLPLELKPQTPEFGELSSTAEDNEFLPIPDGFSDQEKNLINYHRHILGNNEQLTDEQGTTTIYITGVQGPDGREYLIPGYFNGVRQDAETAAIRASLVGWKNYPSYKDPEEAQRAVSKLKQVINSDSAVFENVGMPLSPSTAQGKSIDPMNLDVEEEEAARTVEVGNKVPLHERTVVAAPVPGKRPWDFSTPPSKLTRGLYNNNPGNIRKGSKPWMGQKEGEDPDFVTFQNATLGIRALGRVLRTYREKHGLNNIEGIITRWAPPNENNTNAYIKSVSDKVGIHPVDPVNMEDPEVALRLVKAIIYHENGSQPYSDETIMSGLRLSGLLGSDV